MEEDAGVKKLSTEPQNWDAVQSSDSQSSLGLPPRGPTQPCLAKGGEGYLEICLDEGDGNAAQLHSSHTLVK